MRSLVLVAVGASMAAAAACTLVATARCDGRAAAARARVRPADEERGAVDADHAGAGSSSRAGSPGADAAANDRDRACCRAAALPADAAALEGRDCPICLCALVGEEGSARGPVVLLACAHAFHARCVGRWLAAKRTCPTCRGRMAN